jgi:hypothetical protein
MELQPNEHIIQLSGKASLLTPLNEGESYKIETEIDIVDINHKNRQDGTKDIVYKGKTTGVVEITDKLGKKVKSKDTRTPSQKLRFAIEIYHQGHNGEPDYEFVHPDSEEFYRQTMGKIMAGIDNIIRLIYK